MSIAARFIREDPAVRGDARLFSAAFPLYLRNALEHVSDGIIRYQEVNGSGHEPDVKPK